MAWLFRRNSQVPKDTAEALEQAPAPYAKAGWGSGLQNPPRRLGTPPTSHQHPAQHNPFVSYFGGSGAGKGWLKVMVLPDAALLRALLTSAETRIYRMHLFLEGEGVRTAAEVVSDYERFIESWSAPIHCRTGRSGFDRFWLASQSNAPLLHEASDHEKCYWRFELPGVLCQESLVNVGEDGRIGTTFGDGLWCGLEFDYPDVFSTSATGWQSVSTKVLPDRAVFEGVQQLVRGSTQPLTFVVDGKKKRSRIRISPSMRAKAASVFNREGSRLRVAD